MLQVKQFDNQVQISPTSSTSSSTSHQKKAEVNPYLSSIYQDSQDPYDLGKM